MSKLNPLLKGLVSAKPQGLLIPVLREYVMRREMQKKSGELKEREIVVADAKLTIAAMRQRQREFNHGVKEEFFYFHPSQIGRCLREVWYQAMNAPAGEAQDAESLLRMYLIFDIGTYLHVVAQNLCQSAGIMQFKDREILLKSDKIGVIGHEDGEVVINGKRYTLEIKTINSRGFTGLKVAKHEHRLQASVYMKVRGTDGAIIFYINKDTCELKEFLVEPDEMFEEEAKPRIETFFAAYKKKKPPPREGNSPASMPCKWCAYQRVCFDSKESDAFLATVKGKKLLPAPPTE